MMEAFGFIPMHYNLLFTILFVVLFTSQYDARLLSLEPGQSHVIQRKPKGSENRANYEERDRIRRDTIPSELIHTHTTLEGDLHNYAAIHWSGLKKSSVVFIITYDLNNDNTVITDSTLWRSDDYGATFTEQTSKFDSDVILDAFAISETDHTKIAIADSSNGVVYVTSDEGATYTKVSTGDPFDWFDFYPGNDQVMAAYNKIDRKVLGSVTGGLSWFTMVEDVDSYKLGDPGSSQYMYVILQDQLLYKVHIQTSITKALVDTNLGAVVVTYLNRVGDYMFVQKEEANNVLALWVSHLGGSFRKALFPTATYIANQVYHIVSVHNKQLLVLLTSSQSTGLVGDLFLSDETGTFYTLSLENVLTLVYGDFTQADVHVVNGMNGTILANVYVPTNQAMTMITFDSGAEWSLVPAASNDFCYLPYCSLNFLLSLTALAHNIQTTLFSRSSSVGVLLAIGRESASIPIGEAISPAEISLFVSTDGGVSWSRTHTGSWLVTFADHAGVITAVKDYLSEQAHLLEYSLDEGQSWYQYSFSEYNVTIGGLVTEPGEATLVDVLFAYDNTATNPDWEIVTVDYSGILSTPCQDNDYFSWSPYNTRIGRDCLLGSSISWERKKPTSICYNGLEYERETNITICTCTIVDYECDWGYKHTNPTSEECIVDITQPPNPYTQSCTVGVSSYSITKGFRKIAGDVCMGGDTFLYEPTVVSCNGTGDIMFGSTDLKDHWATLGKSIEFLVTETTAKEYDHFIWDFGDGSDRETVLGKIIHHTFMKTGTFKVQVFTSDYQYTYSEAIFVANQIHGGVYSHLYGAQVGAQTVFNSYLTSGNSVANNSNISQSIFGYTHFSVWFNISGGKIGNSDYLTQDYSFEHVFYSPGTYILKVSVASPVNTFTLEFPVQVYPKLFVIELKFNQIFNISQAASPHQWLNQVNTAIMTKLADLDIITPQTELEVNIQPNSYILYLAFNVEGANVAFTTLQSKLVTSVNNGGFGISIDSYHGSAISVRDVTDLIQVDAGDYQAYAGGIVFLVLIVLTLGFLLVVSAVVIILMIRLTRKSNSFTNRTTRGVNRNLYTGINMQSDDMDPLNADSSDDEHLLPLEAAQPETRTKTDSPDI
ncbi:VPS10 domain-containing receptor SorCS1-like [Oopsacas minuta]|uniref:VPS10 domain-containing receptor SorCS1-like n=1 Tax=Oopsacas minuta TaxID=111878 RepID=A0AAV7K9S1_9METZ|nr:VPS10 domain-containing receptor SorCS1-like [Oopsacas minuta]